MPKKSEIPQKVMNLVRSTNHATGQWLAESIQADSNLVYVTLLRLVKAGKLVREGDRKHYVYRIPQ
jgi:predicted transcriptional regulator